MSDVLQNSTVFNEIKNQALILSKNMGKGIKLEINAISKENIKNCSIKLVVEVD
jgi:hypothetical protein